jgi:hypothetical protein
MRGHDEAHEAPRVLVVGSGTGTQVEDGQADWNEPKQIGDFDVAIFDLHNLECRAQEFGHPYFNSDEAVMFPDRGTIRQHLDAENDIVVRLPKEQTATAYHDSFGAAEYDLTKWLPFRLKLADTTGQQVTIPDVEDHPEANSQTWRKYFDGLKEQGYQPLEGWHNAIESVGPVSQRSTVYTDPSPPEPDDDGIVRKATPAPKSRASHRGKTPPSPGVHPIRMDNLDRPIAARVSVAYTEEIGENRSVDFPYLGSVYVLPPSPELSHSEFVNRYLWAKHNLLPGPSLPGWVTRYPIVGEKNLQAEVDDLVARVDELEHEVQNAKSARNQLLWGRGDELEAVVREAFREFGFEVDGEVPGARDGTVHTSNCVFVLETTGRKGGVSQSKIDKLERHMQDARDDYEAEQVRGLLVFNHRREEPPEERCLQSNNFEEDLVEANQTLLTTVDLYHLLNQFHRGEVVKEDIEARLESNEPIITVDVETPTAKSTGSGGLLSTLKSVKGRIDGLLNRRR